MHCHICNKSEEGTQYVRGIYEGEVVDVCKTCAAIERIPVLRKATQDQINKANVHYSVRERMERMSNVKPTMATDQSVARRNLSKLNFPQQRKDQEGLVENYDWKMKTARRRHKLSIAQLALTSGVSAEDIQKLENGQGISGMETAIAKLEVSLGVQLSKYKSKIQPASFEEPKEEFLMQPEEQILELPKKEKKGLFKRMISGKFDFSKKENIENITLRDLAELKKQREKQEMFGDEVELEEVEENDEQKD